MCAVALLSISLSACSEEAREVAPPAPEGAALKPIPELRFAGASLILVLRRVATEARLLLVVDEYRDPESSPDLLYYNVDADLPVGPVHQALEVLAKLSQAFDFRIEQNQIYVRSKALAGSQTPLDVPFLKAREWNGALPKLTRFIMKRAPRTLVRAVPTQGQPYYQKVSLQIDRGDSVIDVLRKYSRVVNRGLLIRRAGHLVSEEEGKTSFMASTVELWGPLEVASYVPAMRQDRSIVTALALGQEVTGTPIAVFDRTVIRDLRGALDYPLKKYNPDYEFVENMDSMGKNKLEGGFNFSWSMQDGVAVVRSSRMELFVSGHDLLHESLSGGRFSGTLSEFVRWLTAHRVEPSERRLMAGEITGEGARGELEIADGTTVQQALIDFARAADEGLYYLIMESDQVDPQAAASPTASQGAFISRLDDWMNPADRPGDVARAD